MSLPNDLDINKPLGTIVCDECKRDLTALCFEKITTRATTRDLTNDSVLSLQCPRCRNVVKFDIYLHQQKR